MKNKEERNERKSDTETLNEKHAELTGNDLEQVTGGTESKTKTKRAVVTFKLDVPAADESDIVEMN